MKYVIQIETEDGIIYKNAIPVPQSVTHFLNEACLFNKPSTAKRFLQNNLFLRNYSVVPISEVEIFKARLAGI